VLQPTPADTGAAALGAAALGAFAGAGAAGAGIALGLGSPEEFEAGTIWSLTRTTPGSASAASVTALIASDKSTAACSRACVFHVFPPRMRRAVGISRAIVIRVSMTYFLTDKGSLCVNRSGQAPDAPLSARIASTAWAGAALSMF
jgi:hypothetical protein